MRRIRLNVVIACMLAPMLGGCELIAPWNPGDTPDPDTSHWQNLGLHDLEVNRLRYYAPYLYAISYQQGLWRTRIGSATATWAFLGQADTEPTSEGVPFSALNDVFQDPENPDRLLAARLQNCCRGDFRSVFRSDDGGQTWVHTSAGVEETLRMGNTVIHTAYGRITDFAYLDRQVLGLGPRLKTTTDGGITWAVQAEIRPQAHIYRQHPRRPDLIWSATNKQFFKDAITLSVSADGARTWTSTDVLSGPGIAGHRGIGSLAFDVEDVDVAYAGITVDQLLLKTTDGGATWDSLDTSAFGDCCLLVQGSLHQANTLWASNGTILLSSTNGGSSWEPIPTPWSTPRTITTLGWGPRGLLVGTAKGLYALIP